MRKILVSTLILLALCGGAAAAIIATEARAQSPHRPMMVALVGPGGQMTADPAEDGGSMPDRDGGGEAARRTEICRDLYAREVGRLAYGQARLDLSAAQEPLFEHWKSTRLAVARARQTQCAARPALRAEATRPSIVDRMAHREERLRTRLAELDSERPALEAFYSSLSPRQKMQMGFDAAPPTGRLFGGGMDRGQRFAAGHPPLPGAPPSAP